MSQGELPRSQLRVPSISWNGTWGSWQLCSPGHKRWQAMTWRVVSHQCVQVSAESPMPGPLHAEKSVTPLASYEYPTFLRALWPLPGMNSGLLLFPDHSERVYNFCPQVSALSALLPGPLRVGLLWFKSPELTPDFAVFGCHTFPEAMPAGWPGWLDKDRLRERRKYQEGKWLVNISKYSSTSQK